MAKKSTAASEINGFIAVTNEKPKTTSKPGAVKNTSSTSLKSSKPTASIKDVKKVKSEGASRATKKGTSADETKRTETKSKSVAKTTSLTKTSTVTSKKPAGASKSSTNATISNESTVKVAPAKVQSTTSVKSLPATSTSKTRVVKTDAKLIKATPTTVKKVAAPTTVKRVTGPANNALKPTSKDKNAQKATRDIKTNLKAGQDTKVRPVQKPSVQAASPPAKIKNGVGNQKASLASKPKVPLKSSKDFSGSNLTKKATDADEEQVVGKSGLAFNITLEPAKSSKPTAQGPTNGTVDAKSSVNDSRTPAPPPLVKQGTFVKDEEDEEATNSLPHIIAPDELDVSRDDGASEYRDDYEDYESDFEEASQTDKSISEASAAIGPNTKQDVAIVRPPSGATSRQDSLNMTQDPVLESELTTATTEPVNQLTTSVTAQEPAIPGDSNNYEYDDDFEDYSSDFEDDTESGFTSSNDTSESSSATESSKGGEVEPSKPGSKGKVVEEERKLDSGNYDLKTSIMKSDVFKQSQLNYIKEAISRENTMFKDGGPIKKPPSPPPLQIMDFKAAYERFNSDSPTATPKVEKRQYASRGKTILSMIKLHVMEFHMFEMKTMSYEEYIKWRGQTNQTQQETQTKDDAPWEETQTDHIETEERWTQCPIRYHSWAGKPVDWSIYLEDKSGFGTEQLPLIQTKQFFDTNYNTKRLHTFVTNAAQVMTVLLEEEAFGFKNALSLQQSAADFGFSDGYIPIYCDDIDFLKDRKVTHICFSPHFSNVVATCYDRSSQPEEYLPVELTGRWLICFWDMIAVSQPVKILVSSAPIESITFDYSYPNLFYAGLSDGTLCLWDLSEADMDHDNCRLENFDCIIRTPTYCTFKKGLDTTDIHTSPVTHLKSLSSSVNWHGENTSASPSTLYSMSQDGKFMIWTVVHLPDSGMYRHKPDIRLSPWGRVSLILTAVHRPIETAPKAVRPQLEFLCMEVKKTTSPAVLLGSNFGFVYQYSLGALKAAIFQYGETNGSLQITAIELCPHDDRCFLVGVSDGTLRLHSEMASQPLKIFSITGAANSGIACIRWSMFKAGLIVTLDQQANALIWNLCKSDLHPIVKMSFKAPAQKKSAEIQKMAERSSLPPEKMDALVKFLTHTNGLREKSRAHEMDVSRDIRLPYLGIIVTESTVHVHRFNDEFATKGADIKNEELSILRTYLELLHK